MAAHFISLRKFMTEVSSSIVSANEQLRHDAGDAESMQVGIPYVMPLELKNVRVHFSAKIINQKPNSNADEILLDFSCKDKKALNSISAEMIFSGKGKPMYLTEDCNALPDMDYIGNIESCDGEELADVQETSFPEAEADITEQEKVGGDAAKKTALTGTILI